MASQGHKYSIERADKLQQRSYLIISKAIRITDVDIKNMVSFFFFLSPFYKKIYHIKML